MGDLILLLLQNKFLSTLVVIWLVSTVAGAIGKASRRAAPRQSQSDLDAYLERRRSQTSAEASPPAPPTSADEIARQMRELLGLEPPRATRSGPPEGGDEASIGDRRVSVERDTGDEVVHRGAPHVGELHEEIERRRQQRREQQRQERAEAAAPTKVSAPQGAGTARPMVIQPAMKSTVRRDEPTIFFDPKAVVAALVAQAVLGPPRALQPYDSDRISG